MHAPEPDACGSKPLPVPPPPYTATKPLPASSVGAPNAKHASAMVVTPGRAARGEPHARGSRLPAAMATPATSPIASWRTTSSASRGPGRSPETSAPVTASVRITAIGSLTPDSTSSRCASRWRMLTPALRRVEKTAAASVDETIAPTRSDSGQPRPSARAPIASTAAVPAAPAVASTVAGASTRRRLWRSVLSPPSKRIRTGATAPIRRRERVVLERDLSEPLGAGEHPDEQEQERDRQAEPARGARRDHADREQRPDGGEEEGGGERLGRHRARAYGRGCGQSRPPLGAARPGVRLRRGAERAAPATA